jgi:DNA-binding transcriptional LysR family regulator
LKFLVPGELGWSLYASPAYVERTGLAVGADIADGALTGQPIIGYAGAAARSAGGLWLAAHSRPQDVVLTCESVLSVLNAVRAGLGVSLLPCFAANGDPTLARLTPAVLARAEAFLVIPPDHRNTVRIRLVMDALTVLFERERTMLDGSANPE